MTLSQDCGIELVSGLWDELSDHSPFIPCSDQLRVSAEEKADKLGEEMIAQTQVLSCFRAPETV